jgi:hypothetical protein
MFKVFLLQAMLLSFCVSQTTVDAFGDGSYKFTYLVNADNTISITLDAAVTGWVGFGLSDSGTMSGSDLILCYADATGKAVCQDSIASGHTVTADTSNGGTNDIQNVKGTLANGRMTISFSRNLSPTDKNDKAIVKGANMYVLFAYKTSGNAATDGFLQHNNMTAKQMILYKDTATTTTGTTGSTTGTSSTGTTPSTTGTSSGSTTGTTSGSTTGTTSGTTSGSTTGTTSGSTTGTSSTGTTGSGTTTSTTGTTGGTTSGSTAGSTTSTTGTTGSTTPTTGTTGSTTPTTGTTGSTTSTTGTTGTTTSGTTSGTTGTTGTTTSTSNGNSSSSMTYNIALVILALISVF